MSKAQLENGYTKIANQIVDKLCCIRLSGYESMILWCVFRKTYGFNKKEDWIANSQIVKQTGLYKSHVSRAIKKLKEMNIVTKNGNRLLINTNTSSWLPKQVTINKVTKNGHSVTKNGISKLPKMADTKETITKDNIQKKRLPKESDINLINIKKIQTDYRVPESFVLNCWDNVMNYCHGNGVKYVDFSRVLRKFVKDDAIKLIRKDKNDRAYKNKHKAIDASHL